MGITLVGIAGAIFMLGSFVLPVGGMMIAGSVLLGSALIANQLSAK
jgi:hypothetical protein